MHSSPGIDNQDETGFPKIYERDIDKFKCWELTTQKYSVIFCSCYYIYDSKELSAAIKAKFPDNILGALSRIKYTRARFNSQEYAIEFAFDCETPVISLRENGIDIGDSTVFPIFTHQYPQKFHKFYLTGLPLIRKEILKEYIQEIMSKYGKIVFILFYNASGTELFGGTADVILYGDSIYWTKRKAKYENEVYSDDEGKKYIIRIHKRYN
ncbi:hypothetical protein PHYBLDRAFT_165632 [Phycomyces blakesleeanus NRRL 1555(-)]|uniref:Uncharacterized protein n=1 Tax=Phycomyces blakesleeanus (strain ATCC 8743b / DSM 1359 / FGSC 10004 / NBRC 33097 / NRRL 1555) TaxID=763407 RepID=A0A167P2U8_PHYB8|nr:hypothetical protein PHYBLDRAFT_165632 [Phycomyces blakesleeanus NRRL 1555(-)]OAD77141.1 hypothetical protein PHYBLDRAFT_165632 [Phycomyces blakesleeanus NRRL 1555(-)]|eukprot:XP_018295181.1 hypothetical protein PHYBLDRAFT_165632 [Phycomyces blakesleeanus NRRL 1555(-)]